MTSVNKGIITRGMLARLTDTILTPVRKLTEIMISPTPKKQVNNTGIPKPGSNSEQYEDAYTVTPVDNLESEYETDYETNDIADVATNPEQAFSDMVNPQELTKEEAPCRVSPTQSNTDSLTKKNIRRVKKPRKPKRGHTVHLKNKRRVKTDQIEKNTKYCNYDCKFGRKDSGQMTKCCICMCWFHDACNNITSKNRSVIWNCDHCRNMPAIITQLREDVSHIRRQMDMQNDIMDAMNNTLHELSSTNFLFADQLKKSSLEKEAIKRENNKLYDELAKHKILIQRNSNDIESINENDSPAEIDEKLPAPNGFMRPLNPQAPDFKPGEPNYSTQNLVDATHVSNHQKYYESTYNSYDEPKNTYKANIRKVVDANLSNDTAPHKTVDVLILGSSNIKRLDPKTLTKGPDTHVNKEVHYLLQDVCDRIPSVSEDILIIHCGTNNITREPAHYVIHRLKRLETLIKRNNHIKYVIISALGPRKDSFDSDNKTRMVNAAIELICESNQWGFISNKNITMRHIGPDGYHLTAEGASILAGNFECALSDILEDGNFLSYPHKTNP